MSQQVVEGWKPAHDQMVALHLAGYQTNRIAQVMEYSREHVGVILGDPRALKMIIEFRRRIREKTLGDIEDTIVDLAEISLKKIGDTVEAEFDAGSKGKEHQDKMGFKLLACLGYNGQNRKQEESRKLQMSSEMEGRLVAALEKTAEVDELIANAVEVEVIEEGEEVASESG